MVKRTVKIVLAVILFLFFLSCYACAQIANPSVRQTLYESRENFVEYEYDLRNVLKKHGLEIRHMMVREQFVCYGVAMNNEMIIHVDVSENSRLTIRLRNQEKFEDFYIQYSNLLPSTHYLYEAIDVDLLVNLTNAVSGRLAANEDLEQVLQWARERCLEGKQGRSGWEGLVAAEDGGLDFFDNWRFRYRARERSSQGRVDEVFEIEGLTKHGTRRGIFLR